MFPQFLKVAQSHCVSWIGLITFVVGIPGIIDDGAAWLRWLEMIAYQTVAPFAFWGGLILMSPFLWKVVRDRTGKYRFRGLKGDIEEFL